MEARKILARAESQKRRVHRLSLDLRLRSASDTKKFIREQGVVLWREREELPCVLDAILVRIANAQERRRGKPVENCALWRRQLLHDLDLLECSFFRKRSTVLYQDLWPYLAACSRANLHRSEEDGSLSRDARRVLSFLTAEGPTRSDLLRRALKYHSAQEGRAFQRAVNELSNRLLLVARDDQDAAGRSRVSLLDSLENAVPKALRTRSDSLSEKEAAGRLMISTLNSCVLAAEKNVRTWFPWLAQDPREMVETMIRSRDCLRVKTSQTAWLVSRKALGLKKAH